MSCASSGEPGTTPCPLCSPDDPRTHDYTHGTTDEGDYPYSEQVRKFNSYYLKDNRQELIRGEGSGPALGTCALPTRASEG